MKSYNAIIIGAGAAGMFCSIQAARYGKSVLVIDHAKKAGEKIRISGGGRCNFTNANCKPDNFISKNPHFAKSALARYTQYDFIELVDRYRITWHEKKLGQLFCDGKSNQIIDMLLNEMKTHGVEMHLQTKVSRVAATGKGYTVEVDGKMAYHADQLVIASGGKSIPKMGATGFGYEIAEQFGLDIIEPRPALVPLTLDQNLLEQTKLLAGTAVDCRVSCGKTAFEEAMLFTHRGLSGPAILQISSYWKEGQMVSIDMVPAGNLQEVLREAKSSSGNKSLSTVLSSVLPSKLAYAVTSELQFSGNIADLSGEQISALENRLVDWELNPAGSEGYRTAEVTLGGVDTNGLSSKSMEAKRMPGLYFIGEVVDVTGWLGGYNFQWAWSSAYAAGSHISEQ